MKRRSLSFLIPSIVLMLILISGSRNVHVTDGVFEIGKVYKLTDKINSTITVKVLEVKGAWILYDPDYTNSKDDDSVELWVNTSRFSFAEVMN